MKIKLYVLILAAFLALCARAQAFQLYFGDLHSHTSFSDGKGVPADAYDMARNDAHLDFWSVTDHYEQIDIVKGLPPGVPPQKEWKVMHDTAAAKTENGKFVAIAGFEWFDQTEGHINVLNSVEVPKLPQTLNLKKFYKWAEKHPDILIGFNHPADSAGNGAKVFDGMAYVPEVASQTFYVAVIQDADFKYYYMALDNGWRVGASGQQDNHQANWGLEKPITGVYADSLTYDGLMQAFRARRIYATNNRNIRLDFNANGNPMGSEITAPNADFTITASIKAGGTISTVALVSNGGKTLKEWKEDSDKSELKYSLPVDYEGKRWYVAVVRDKDGKFAVSAPVWFSK